MSGEFMVSYLCLFAMPRETFERLRRSPRWDSAVQALDVRLDESFSGLGSWSSPILRFSDLAQSRSAKISIHQILILGAKNGTISRQPNDTESKMRNTRKQLLNGRSPTI